MLGAAYSPHWGEEWDIINQRSDFDQPKSPWHWASQVICAHMMFMWMRCRENKRDLLEAVLALNWPNTCPFSDPKQEFVCWLLC